MNMIANVIVTH